MKPSVNLSEAKLAKIILNYFNKNQIEELAHQTGFVSRHRKLTGYAFILIMVFEIRKTRLESLNELSIKLEDEKIYISKQGLDNRFNEYSVAFMKKLSSNVLSAKIDSESILENATSFPRIILRDSTHFQLPASYSEQYRGSGGKASASGMKIQYEYDLKSNTGLDIEVQSLCTPDITSKLQNIQPKDLRIEDLGYFKLERFEEIANNQAFFLSRFKYSILVYTKNADQYQRINIDDLINRMKQGEIKELEVYLGQNQKLPVRLILERVPDVLAAEKRRKIKTDKHRKGKSISKQRLAFCDVNAYITNADQDQLPIDIVRSVYSLRWQIEIIFKTWKSTFNLDKLKQMKIHRFDCINYGTLLQIIICTKLYNYYKIAIWNKSSIELSELKSFRQLILTTHQLISYIKCGQVKQMIELLRNTGDTLARKCRKERKKDKTTPAMILSSFSLT